jgi:hypothetical protein
MTKFLLRTTDRDAFDTFLVNGGFATFEDRDEEQVSVEVPYPVTIDGEAVNVNRTFNFLASTIQGWSLPRTVEVSVPVQVNGSGGNRIMDFVVDDLRNIQVNREDWISFTVNGVRHRVPANGGKILNSEPGVRIYEMDPTNGIPLMNIRAVYDGDTQVVAPSKIPGFFSVMSFYGERRQDDKLVSPDPEDQSLWATSAFAKDFKDTGTERTYTRSASQTDWDEGYTLTYYEKDFGGVTVGLVDPYDLPKQILAQHGMVR